MERKSLRPRFKHARDVYRPTPEPKRVRLGIATRLKVAPGVETQAGSDLTNRDAKILHCDQSAPPRRSSTTGGCWSVGPVARTLISPEILGSTSYESEFPRI